MSIFGKHEEPGDSFPAEPDQPEQAVAVMSPPDAEPEAPAPSATKPVEEWATLKSTPDWAFGATKASNAWGQGRELTEADYEAAVEKAVGTKMLAP